MERDLRGQPGRTAPARVGIPGLGTTSPGGREVAGLAEAAARAGSGRLDRTGPALLRLQRQYGNRHVQRVVQQARAVGPAAVVQPRMVIGQPDDRWERQADRVAGWVVDRAGSGPEAGGARWRRPPGPAGLPLVDPQVGSAIREAGAGRPLPPEVRASMEPALGAELGGVRLHTDALADRLAGTLGARSFTTGQEIFFRRGEYRPGSRAGRWLLAHELTHTVQQGGAARPEGAGVIQRVLIGDHDTEKPAGLRELKRQARALQTVAEVDAMLARLEGTNRSDNEKALTKTLQMQKDLLATQLQAQQGKEARQRAKATAPVVRKVAEIPTRDPAAEQAREDQEVAPRIAEIEPRIAAGLLKLDRWFHEPEIKVLEPRPLVLGGGSYTRRIPDLLLERVVVDAMADLEKRGNAWFRRLLAFLAETRKTQKATGDKDPGPLFKVLGTTVSNPEGGSTTLNSILIRVFFSGLDAKSVLLDDEGAYARERDRLVTRTASAFIHELAHLRQLRAYDNLGRPWTTKARDERGRSHNDERPFPDVPAAFAELAAGGVKRQAKDDGKTRRAIFEQLESYRKTERGDLRSSELVSHLIELLYAWEDEGYDEGYLRQVLPKGAALLDRVILRGT